MKATHSKKKKKNRYSYVIKMKKPSDLKGNTEYFS